MSFKKVFLEDAKLGLALLTIVTIVLFGVKIVKESPKYINE